jgi:dihydroorotase-like cyclic amidohydrolase
MMKILLLKYEYGIEVRVNEMAKQLRLKKKILMKLEEGPMNTCQIYDWVESNKVAPRGVSMMKLVNLLSKNPKDFVRLGKEKVRSPANSYNVWIWGRRKEE